MSSPHRLRELVAIPALVTLILASALPAQRVEVESRSGVVLPHALRPSSLGARCAANETRDPVVESVAAALGAADPEALDALLDQLEAELVATSDGRESDVDTRYRLAVVLGARVENRQGRARLEAAERLYHQSLYVLDAEPEHPGAHHLLGRLTAGVLRLGGATRFLARLVVGGELISSASWNRAREHLARAEAGAPCVPEHHYELARLLGESGDAAGARRELAGR